MEKKNKLIIGLFGLGVVGNGLHQVLSGAYNTHVKIKQVCIKNPDKKRELSKDLLTTHKEDILNDPEINLVVELIDDAEEAYHIVKAALLKGKSVVSANKKMLAYHLEELVGIQQEQKVALLYDASACGSIPVIRNLEEYYDIDLLQSVTGILNGSSNYILSKMYNEDQSYTTALAQAQELGFAESDPLSDVGGYDSLYKLVIITLHSFGLILNPDEIMNFGIQNISPFDMCYAKEKGCKIKLIAQVIRINENEISLYVLPKLISSDKHTYNVDYEYNGVVIKGKYYDKQFIFGKGAGGTPTATSVLSDISARSYGYTYEYKKRSIHKGLRYQTAHELDIYLRYTKSEDRELFPFEEVYESHFGKQYNFVTGRIKLSSLLYIKKELSEHDVFIAVVDKNKLQV